MKPNDSLRNLSGRNWSDVQVECAMYHSYPVQTLQLSSVLSMRKSKEELKCVQVIVYKIKLSWPLNQVESARE